MRYFDYSFLEQAILPAHLVNTVCEITVLHERIEGQKQRLTTVFNALKDEIQALPAGSSDKASDTNYSDALTLIHVNYENIDIREGDILWLHEILLAGAPEGGGRYKQSATVGAEIKRLITAYEEARDNPYVNRLLLIPYFILDFLCLRPFADGNDRMARLLALLMLHKSGFDAGLFISYEEQIDRTKDRYFQALKASGTGWREERNSYFPFMEQFLETVLSCYRDLTARIGVSDGGKATKRQRIEATVLNSAQPISKGEICRTLPDVSQTTVEAVLADMLKGGLIEKLGSARSTRYRSAK